jgi:hypothetical protein
MCTTMLIKEPPSIASVDDLFRASKTRKKDYQIPLLETATEIKRNP